MKCKYPFRLVLVNADGEAVTVVEEITDWDNKNQTLTISYGETDNIEGKDIMKDIIITLNQTAKG